MRGHQSLNGEQKLIVLLALCPEFAPTLIERCLKKHLESGGDLPAFGGVRGTQHRGIIPTGETALFLLGAADLDSRLRVRKYFDPETRLVSDNFIELHPPPAGEPSLAGRLVPHLDILQRLISGKVDLPTFSPSFPAQLLETNLTWEDLVLPERSLQEIAYLKITSTTTNDSPVTPPTAATAVAAIARCFTVRRARGRP